MVSQLSTACLTTFIVGSQIAEYIDATFGGPDRLRKDHFYDFFKSSFDGASKPETRNPEPRTLTPGI